MCRHQSGYSWNDVNICWLYGPRNGSGIWISSYVFFPVIRWFWPDKVLTKQTRESYFVPLICSFVRSLASSLSLRSYWGKRNSSSVNRNLLTRIAKAHWKNAHHRYFAASGVCVCFFFALRFTLGVNVMQFITRTIYRIMILPVRFHLENHRVQAPHFCFSV